MGYIYIEICSFIDLGLVITKLFICPLGVTDCDDREILKLHRNIYLKELLSLNLSSPTLGFTTLDLDL